MTLVRTRIAAAMLGAGLLAVPFGGVAQAQDGATQPETSVQVPARPVSQTEVQQMAEATLALNALNAELQAELSQAETPEAQTRLRQQGQARMVEAIRQTGLTVPRYNAIIKVAQKDQGLVERIREAAQDM